ncbi:MAG: hypothetical protein V3V67_16165, partial [Myxococcota bacterium]
MSLRYRLELAAYVAGSALLRSLPLATAQRLGALGARAYFRLHGKGVRRTLTNLRIAYPQASEAEIAEIGRQSCIHFAWNVIDVARAEEWGDDDLRARIDFVGLEELRELLDRGQGALLLSLHMGSFDLGLRRYSLEFPERQPAVVSRPLRNPLLAERMVATRTGRGAELIPHKRGAARGMLRALRTGRPIVVLNDQYSSRSRGVFVPLFGLRCSTSAGVATIALRTGAPVVPCYVVRDAPDHQTAYFLPPLEPPASGDRQKDI